MKEISLVYDMSDYFKAKEQFLEVMKQLEKKQDSKFYRLRYEMLVDKLESFIAHFNKFKPAYFQNRGFVTFKTHRIAQEVKDIYNRSGIQNDDYIDRLEKKLVGLVKKEKPEDKQEP